MEDFITLRWFYPMLFLTISIITIVLICTIKTVLVKFKDKDSQNFQFKAHIDEHINTTDKFSKAHTEVIEHTLPPVYEKELHSLEQNNKLVITMLKEITIKLDFLIENTKK